MTGKDYADLVAGYVVHNFGGKQLVVFREVPVGKSIIGKNRRVDVFIVHEPSNRAFVIECKFQESSGTADEKIPYALEDMRHLPIDGCIVYAGAGFSEGVLHLLQGSHLAAYCQPDPRNLASNKRTWELDHILAMHFGWWDVLTRDHVPYRPAAADSAADDFDPNQQTLFGPKV